MNANEWVSCSSSSGSVTQVYCVKARSYEQCVSNVTGDVRFPRQCRLLGWDIQDDEVCAFLRNVSKHLRHYTRQISANSIVYIHSFGNSDSNQPPWVGYSIRSMTNSENFRNMKAKLFSSVSLFYPENGEWTFLRNVGKLLLDCTARHMPEDSIINSVSLCLKSFVNLLSQNMCVENRIQNGRHLSRSPCSLLVANES
jgi:hypothetical protein